PISINFDAKLGEYTTLKVDGAAKPFAYKIDLDADIDLKNLNMVPLSSYTIRMFGNVITSGQLNVVSTVHIANGSIDAMNTLRMNKLKVKKTSDEMAAAVENEVGMPLNKALSTLQDKRGNIKLDVPIKGKLDEIKIGYGGIINKVLAKALIAGTTSYLKYMFPTYGIAYTIAKKVGEEVTKVRIGPVIYEPGHAELTDTHEDFIKKIAKVMDERPQIEPQICGFMTEQDLLVVAGEKAREWYKQDDEGKQVLDIEAVSKDMKERVIILGYGRAKAIKDRLVSKYGIDPGRLYVCAPEYDNEADAKPRVELLI
ncbi:MAG: DUF748 domain-containing protein, partial [Planctomycetes bacterium]|nr:DUF748 domain-containing protein [Planctomycetota bacterium]